MTDTFKASFPILNFLHSALNNMIKRSFDIIFAIFVFVLIFTWLWPVIIILQKILNPGPVFYRARRWGKDGKNFFCYKFRSMIPGTDSAGENGTLTKKCSDCNDPRLTRFGKFLRRTDLDELPQFINVLKGEMSVVGPRPHDASESLELKDQIKFYMKRHHAKPGITGWAQIKGYRGSTDDIDLMRIRTEYDIWYIDNQSFCLDMKIVFRTVYDLLRGNPHSS